MAIDARAALRRGAADLATVHGVSLYVAFAVVAVLTLPINQTLTAEMSSFFVDVANVPAEQVLRPATPLAIELSLPLLAAGLVVTFLVTEGMHLFAIRSFASDGLVIAPAGGADGNLLMTYVTLLLASLAVQVLVYAGLFLLVIPGLIAAVLLVFVRQAVVLKDLGVRDAIRRSITLVRDAIVPVTLLLIVLLVLSFVVGSPAALVDPETIPGQVLSVVLGSVTTVYGIAVVTAAFQQAEIEEPSTGALDADDLDRRSLVDERSS